jgi:DNA-binding beta-propeller fold protein YncE
MLVVTDKSISSENNSFNRPLKGKIKVSLQIAALSFFILVFVGFAAAGIGILFSNLQSGAAILGLSSVMVLILVYYLQKGIRNYRKLGFLWDPPATLTEVDVNTIDLQSRSRGIAISTSSNLAYVATSESILLVDGYEDKIIGNIALPSSPAKQVAVNPASEKIVVLLKNSICTIDGRNLAEPPSYLSFNAKLDNVALYPRLNKAYITSSSSKAVFVFDLSTDIIESVIELERPPSGIAVDSSSGKVFVGYKDYGLVSVVDATSNKIVEQIGFPVPAAAVGGELDLYVNPNNQMVYALLRSTLLDGNGGGHELDSLYVFDGKTKSFVDCNSCRLDWKSQTFLSNDGHNYFAVDIESGKVFMTNVEKKKLFALQADGRDTLYSLNLRRGCSGLAVNLNTKKVYVCYNRFFGVNSVDVIYLNDKDGASAGSAGIQNDVNMARPR